MSRRPILLLTCALDAVNCHHHAWSYLSPETTRWLLYTRLGWTYAWSGQARKSSAPTLIWSPGFAARRK